MNSLKTIRSELGYDKYLSTIRSIGFIELPWEKIPALLLKETENKSFLMIEAVHGTFDQLCATIHKLYKHRFPERNQKRSVVVKPMTVSTSQRAQLYHSQIGSQGNQSKPASFVLVKYGTRSLKKGSDEFAARVEFYAKIKVDHEPTLTDGTVEKKSKEEVCLFANVKWFTQHSHLTDPLGVRQKVYKSSSTSMSDFDPWVPLHLISAQFIPLYFKVEGEQLMKPCRVPLKTPC
jgi:hypothetical protein